MLLRSVLLLGALVAARAIAADRPNILWITAEDMSPNLGCYGDRFARTPQLDAFAREAVRYTHAFSVAPVCSPSRATLITGVYANSLGNPHLRCAMPLPAGFVGYAGSLRAAGYFTTNNVKTDYNLRDEARLVREWWNVCSAKAHWRQRAPGQPFMAVFNLMETHQSRTSVWPEEQFEREIGRQLSPAERADPSRVPLPPFYPDLPAARKAMARYYDCIAVMDQKAGKILRELESDGLVNDTIVFFYADHGMGMPRGKRLLHNSGLQVPLLIRFPKKWAHLAPAAPGTTVDRLVSFVDFAPTLLSLAGVPVPGHYQGTAFLGPAAGSPQRYVYGARDRVDEAFDTARTVRDERWVYIRNYRPDLSWAQPEGYSDGSPFRRELLARAQAGELGAGRTAWLAPTRPREELYDAIADPHQLRNVADDPGERETLTRMRSVLREWLLRIRDASFLPEEEMLARTQGAAPYELARSPGRYDFERILAAAERVGDPAAVAQQRAWLTDRDPGVRTWAALGLAANPDGGRQAKGELERALADNAPAVRIEAAGALVRAGQDEKPLELLGREAESADGNIAVHATRTLQLLGEPAQRFLPRFRERLTQLRAGPQTDSALYLSFSLEAMIRRWDTSAAP